MISVRISYGNDDTTGVTAIPRVFYTSGPYVSSISIPWGVHENNTESWDNRPDNISFKEHMRRLRQSLAEMNWPRELPRPPLRPPAPRQGRHGFQQAPRRPGYRKKRPA